MKPILFNTEMVKAIMRGDKTVTRRVVKPQPMSKLAYACMGYKHGTWGYPGADNWKYWEDESFRLPDGLSDKERNRHWTPPYRHGDILYVREAWHKDISRYMYKSDYHDGEKFYRDGNEVSIKWRPSIHMPKEAARIFLRVTDAWVERLDEIDGQGLIDEGLFSLDELRHGLMREKFAAFENLWNSTIKPTDRALYGWDANPFVWVIEFEQISKEEAMNDAIDMWNIRVPNLDTKGGET